MSEEIPINQYLAKMEKTIDRFETKLDKNNEMTEKTLLQATKTNGRVNTLEERLKDYEKDKNKFSGKQQWIIGVGTAAVVLGAVIYAFILKDIQQTITNDFNQCCQAISSQKKTENPNITNTVSVNN